MKKVLILGAGNAQTDAALYLKKKGYKSYGVSYSDKDKAVPLYDEFAVIDIKDVDGICEYAKKEKVDIIYSVGSDLAMPSVMSAGEALGLPHFISSETALTCQNKNKLREFLGSDFVGNVPSITTNKLEAAAEFSIFPAMMKPVDSQGQRGCYKVCKKEDVEKYFSASLGYSVSGNVIIEKYIDGKEVSVNAYMCDGEPVFSLISDRIVFENLPGGIIKEHHLPSVFANDKAQERIHDLVKRVCKKVGIKNGPAYFQIKIENDFPYLIEVTPRLDGCHMWNLIKNYCGVDLLDASFEHLINNKVPDLTPKFKKDALKLIFMCEESGKPFDSSKYDVSGNIYIHKYYEDGETVRKLNGYMEKCGYIIR